MNAAVSALALAGALMSVVVPAEAQAPRSGMARALDAADRAEIVELSAHFDNSLDAEDADKFVSVFTPDGELIGFWGTSKGEGDLRKAHAFMLATFSKHKRHVVTNHEITLDGDRARMFCYLTVFDRDALAVTGTATFTDDLVRQGGRWKFKRRTLAADPNVDPIIKSIQSGK